MNRYDVNRTAANTKETVLNTTNVNPSTFGKLWSYPVTGVIFAQPLYVQGLSIGSKGNVLFVATMQNNIYAFDADKAGAPLWTRILGTPVSSSTWSGEIGNFIGVMSTPVIDNPSSSGSMYVVAQTLESSNWVYRLHKISLLTGQDVVGSSVISGAQSGTTFDPVKQNQRPGLVLVNGQVVITFSGRPHDDRPFHGWVMTYDASTLAQKGIFLTTSSDDGAGVWGSGGAPPVDAAGNFYVLTGNAFNSSTGYNGGNGNYSESLLKMSNAGGTLKLSDWFTAYNWSTLDSLDEDLSCNSPMLVPGSSASTDLLTFGSKTADIYVADISKSLGHLQSNNSQLAGFFHVGANNPAKFSDGDRILGLAYWQGPMGKTVFAWPAFDSLHSYVYTYDGSQWTFSLNHSNPLKGFGEPGVPISVSANGSQSGTGIVWATMFSSSGRSVGQAGDLHAFNAEDMSEIWNSAMDSSRDDIGSPAKFVIPIVANGRVYAAAANVTSSSSSATGVVQVYGILPPSGGGGSLTGSGNNSTAAVNLTTEGGADWLHWGDSTLNRKAGVSAALTTYAVVGGGPVLTGNGDQRAISWSDGTPTASANANLDGAYTYGAIGDGFSFTAPAGTTTQTLIVHVGGFGSSGALTAHLSDNSAPDFTSTTPLVSGQYDQNYTLTYKAGSSGQKLTVTWVIASGTGNVSVQGAALAGTAQSGVTASPTFSPGGGTYTGAQSVVLSDSTSGAVIYYTTNGSTPTTSSTKYSSPILVSSSETIKAFAQASGDTASSVVSASYTIQTGGTGGSLSGTPNNSTAAVNLTSEGGADWLHWGDSTLNRKAGVSAALTTYTVVGGGPVLTGNGDQRAISWSDGTPTASATANLDGAYTYGAIGDGFSFTAPAGTTAQSLTVHVGGFGSSGTLTAHLSDGSAPDYTNTTAFVSGQFDENYTLTYKAGSAGQKLTITWIIASGTGNVSVQAAALAGVAPPVVTASPTFNPGSGAVFASPQSVSLSDTTSGAVIYYTTNGSNPTTSSAVYSSPILVSVSETIKAFAVAPGDTASAVVSASYTVQAPPPPVTASPTFNPGSGAVFASPQSVSLSDATSGAVIYYTTNGSTPTTSSAVYSSPILVSVSETIKAFALAPGDTASAVVSASYTVQTNQPPLTIDYGSGFTSAGLTLNGTASVTGTRLQLTDGGSNEAASAFYSTPVNIQSFTTQFKFQVTQATGDGFTFTLQGAGPNALGSPGGGLGSEHIGTSVTVKFDLYSNNGEGTSSTGIYLNGATPTIPATDLLSQGINLHSGDIFNTQLNYDGTNLTLIITDTVTSKTFTTVFPVNIPGTVGGNTAYVGFTGGSGGATAIQQIIEWTYSTGGTAPPPVTATPTFNPPAGTVFTSPQSVSLSDATSGATIYYTTDGSAPTTGSTVYSSPIPVSASETIKAFATSTGNTDSAVASASYTVQAPPPPSQTATPTFNPPGGTVFTSPQSVSLSDATSGATIYYTTDGSTPTAGSTVYSSPILVGASETIKAFATSTGNADSAVATASYIVQTNQSSTIDFSSGFTSAGLTLNGKSTITGTRLQLTDGGTNEAASAFYSTPVNIQSFTTQFQFQLIKPNADGITFTIQNSGPNALGTSGGGLGSKNIGKSVSVKFDLYNSAGEGTSSTGIYLNGATPTVPATDLLSHGIALHSGDTFKVQLSYDGSNLTLTITDTVTAASFTTAFPVNIAGTVGASTAYVGFTGGTGGATATQQIVQWTYNTP